MIVFHQLAAGGFQFGRHLRQFRHGEALARQWLGFHRERLGWRSLLQRDFALRDLALFHAIDRLAGGAIQQEQQRRLVDDGDGGNGAPAILHIHQNRRRFQVEVEHIVMHDLEMPEILAGGGIHRHQAGIVEIVARAVAAEQVA